MADLGDVRLGLGLGLGLGREKMQVISGVELEWSGVTAAWLPSWN